MSALLLSDGDLNVCTESWSVSSAAGYSIRVSYLGADGMRHVDFRIPMANFVKLLDGRAVVDIRQLAYDNS